MSESVEFLFSKISRPSFVSSWSGDEDNGKLSTSKVSGVLRAWIVFSLVRAKGLTFGVSILVKDRVGCRALGVLDPFSDGVVDDIVLVSG